MSEIIICSAQDQDAAQMGVPAVHSLGRRASSPFAKAWVKRAVYRLPDGYKTVEHPAGQSGIYNAAGHLCPLIDSAYSGSSEGRPIMIDRDRPEGEQVICLPKVYDLTLKTLKKIGG